MRHKCSDHWGEVTELGLGGLIFCPSQRGGTGVQPMEVRIKDGAGEIRLHVSREPQT